MVSEITRMRQQIVELKTGTLTADTLTINFKGIR
jgi:hypothetical protein